MTETPESSGTASSKDGFNARLLDDINAIESEVELFFNHAPFGSHTQFADGTYRSINALESAWLGYSGQDLVGKRRFFDLLTPGSQEVYRRSQAEEDPTTVITDLHLDIVRRDGSVMPISLSSMGLCTSAASPLNRRWMVFDLTESFQEHSRREIETSRLADALALSEERRAIATDSGRIAIWELDLVNGKLAWDENCHLLYKVPKESFKGNFGAWTETLHPEDLDAATLSFRSAIAGLDEYDSVFRILWPDGEVRFIKTHARVLRDQSGAAQRLIGADWDVTEQKRVEEGLRTAVAEKNALLKEVHHRVKNNLQVITSLLRLEVRRSRVANTKEVLGSMAGRIRAMAQLHESLYRSGTFAAVDLGTYLGQIASQSFKAQLASGNRVQLKTNLGAVRVGMDQAVAAGLLLNELLSNCLKHGFKDGESGDVVVELQPADPSTEQTDPMWRLRVSDTGTGLPADFEDKRKQSLGLQLVGDLTHQLGGRLEIASVTGSGVEFSVTFKALKPEPLVIP